MLKLLMISILSFSSFAFDECFVSIKVIGKASDSAMLNNYIHSRLSRRLHRLGVFNEDKGADYTLKINQHGVFVDEEKHQRLAVADIEIFNKNGKVLNHQRISRTLGYYARTRVQNNALHKVTSAAIHNLFLWIPVCDTPIHHTP